VQHAKPGITIVVLAEWRSASHGGEGIATEDFAQVLPAEQGSPTELERTIVPIAINRTWSAHDAAQHRCSSDHPLA
jgi:hypothetical protein